jgi:hypothetical protein
MAKIILEEPDDEFFKIEGDGKPEPQENGRAGAGKGAPPKSKPNRLAAIILDDIEIDEEPVYMIDGLIPPGRRFIWCGAPRSRSRASGSCMPDCTSQRTWPTPAAKCSKARSSM